MFINRAGFQKWLQNESRLAKVSQHDFKHQHIVREYMHAEHPYRGILLYHGLGSGKTRSAIGIAEHLKDRSVCVLLPASLATNFKNEIKKVGPVYMRPLDAFWKYTEDMNDDDGSIPAGVIDVLRSKKKGYFQVSASPKPGFLPYHAFNDEQKRRLDEQVHACIEQRYQFIHYNGLTDTHMNEIQSHRLKKLNFFNGKTVIIDEVHNFISRVVGGSKYSEEVYNHLMDADNVRIVALSGTPIINDAFELSKLLNLLRGTITSYTIVAKDSPTLKRMVHALERDPRTDYLEQHLGKQEVTVFPTPCAFVIDHSTNIMTPDNNDDSPYKQHLQHLLSTAGLKDRVSVSRTGKKELLLPNDPEHFYDNFVDVAKKGTKNDVMLSKRIQGLVSHYDLQDSTNYPRTKQLQVVRVKMSGQQFAEYRRKRAEEQAQEKKARQETVMRSEVMGLNVYKSFSRALCNFVFPDDASRPYPSEIRRRGKALVIETENDDGKQSSYEEALKEALEQLNHHPDNPYKDTLQQYGPKMAAIIHNIGQSKGPVLVYSNFRNVEGLEIFSCTLKKRGWAEITVNGDQLIVPEGAQQYFIKFTGSQKSSGTLLDVYNGNFGALRMGMREVLERRFPNTGDNRYGQVVKALLITQSGSEGISLRNVRQVHIMEPYWNDIRIKQVIGRAVRAKSHDDLPPAEREVQSFMYVSVFDDDVKHDGVCRQDKGLTADELVLNIAKAKAAISDALLKVIKRSSFDCTMYSTRPDCFKVNDKDGILYTASFSQDIRDSDAFIQQQQVVRFYPLPMPHIEDMLVYNMDTFQVFKEVDVLSSMDIDQLAPYGSLVCHNGEVTLHRVT